MKIIALALANLLILVPAAAEAKKAVLPAPAKGEETSAKRRDVKQFLALTGRVPLNVEAARKSIREMKARSSKEIPEAFWAELEKVPTASAFESLLIPIYERRYTDAELKVIIRFLQTPEGRTFILNDGVAQMESGEAFRHYMEDHSKRLMQKYAPPKK